jgi:hypothetical protein
MMLSLVRESSVVVSPISSERRMTAGSVSVLLSAGGGGVSTARDIDLGLSLCSIRYRMELPSCGDHSVCSKNFVDEICSPSRSDVACLPRKFRWMSGGAVLGG